jgi:3-hydroxy-3-methylglutaryl CoA synthase
VSPVTVGPHVGIDRIHVWPCTLALDMAELVEARGGNVEQVVGDMMIDERSLNPPWEDPVTMAVNAARSVLADEDLDAVKLLLVASESGPDQEKPLSTWVQRYLELPDDCRNLEVKHACYAGTGCLQLASSWLLSQPEGVKALVVTTDESRQHFHRPYEFVMGAGACAMLLAREPRFLALDLPLSGVYTHEVSDLFRPTSRVEAGHAETSLLSYLDAVDFTVERYLDAVSATCGTALRTVEDWIRWLPLQVYHAPFGGITTRAHRAALRLMGDVSRQAASRDFAARIEPTLRYNRRMGGTYGSSVFISLLGAVDALGGDGVDRRVGIYAYGSGSCAEFYSGVFGRDAPAQAARAELASALDARRRVDVREYEEAERERTCWIDTPDYCVSTDGHDGWYDRRYRGRGLLRFAGAEDHVRRYEWT